MFYDKPILDKNGDEIHFGDTVENGNGTAYSVSGYESPEGSGVARLIIIRYGGLDENFQVWQATISSENVTLVKPKETLCEIRNEMAANPRLKDGCMGFAEIERYAHRFMNCEEASHGDKI